MKKLSESLWSDLQDRSSGDVVRKEDSVDHLDRNEFFEYLKNHYETTNPFVEIRISNLLNSINVNLFGKVPRNVVDIQMIYNEDTTKYAITMGAYELYCVPDIEKIVRDNFCVVDIPDSNKRGPYVEIYPKETGKNTIITNSFFLQVIDFLLDAAKGKYTILLKKK